MYNSFLSRGHARSERYIVARALPTKSISHALTIEWLSGKAPRIIVLVMNGARYFMLGELV